MKLLSYEPMDSREGSIQDTEGNILDWMLDETVIPQLEPELVQARESCTGRLKSGRDTFHVSGKAGAGKSTLFKLLCHHRRTKSELLGLAGDSRRLMVASFFFFWNSGIPMQTSLEGSFPSLVLQVSREHPDLMPSIFPDVRGILPDLRTSGGHISDEEFLHHDAIKMAWRNLRDLETDYYRMCFLIDGLDGYTQTEEGPSYQFLAEKFREWAGRHQCGVLPIILVLSRVPQCLWPGTTAYSSQTNFSGHQIICNQFLCLLQDARYRVIIVFLVNTITERSEGVFVTAVRSLVALMKRGVKHELVLNQVRNFQFIQIIWLSFTFC